MHKQRRFSKLGESRMEKERNRMLVKEKGEKVT